MKKTILLFIVSVLCGAFFTGCPHETQSEQKSDRYPREFNFDKETFDAQRKAWEESGIKNYYFIRGFDIGGTVVLEKITVENSVPVSKELYYINWNLNPIYGELINFEEYEEKASGLYKDPRHISKDFAEEIQQTPLCTIEDIYTSIEAEYLSMKSADMKQEKIAKIENKIQYDLNYHIPLFFEWKIISEEEYDGAHLNGESFGWEDKIYDFKAFGIAAEQTSKIQNPETDNDKYPRTFMFNKEEFDTQYKAWSDAGIKNYQFKEIFDPDAYGTAVSRAVIRLITVKDGKIETVKYFDANNSDYKEINLDNPPDWLTENGITELKKDIRTIDEIFAYLADWYERNNNTWDLKTMGIATYGRLMEYDEAFHFPSYYQFRYITEYEYDAMMNNDSVFGYNSFIGWRSEIFDFKVLD